MTENDIISILGQPSGINSLPTTCTSFFPDCKSIFYWTYFTIPTSTEEQHSHKLIVGFDANDKVRDFRYEYE